jgi:RNA polymerase sigma factor (sigma-70 family)
MSEPDAMVFVVDDDAQTRDALKNLMRSVGLHVEVFASAQDFLRSKRPDVPACLVLDVRLRGLSGLDLQKRMAEAKIEVPIIFITGYGDIPMTVQAMKAGAVEFLTKPFRNQELLDAIQQALERDRTTREQRAKNEELFDRYDSLTPREREVMTLVVAGLLNKQIAGELGTSETTVKNHRHQLMEKMGADSVAELVKMAYNLGITTEVILTGRRAVQAGPADSVRISPSRHKRSARNPGCRRAAFLIPFFEIQRLVNTEASPLPLPQRDCVAMPKSHECHSEPKAKNLVFPVTWRMPDPSATPQDDS